MLLGGQTFHRMLGVIPPPARGDSGNAPGQSVPESEGSGGHEGKALNTRGHETGVSPSLWGWGQTSYQGRLIFLGGRPYHRMMGAIVQLILKREGARASR